METATTKFRALLDACVAIDRANQSAHISLTSKNASLMQPSDDFGLSADDRAYWDALYHAGEGSEARTLVEELGVLLATTNISVNKMVHLLRILLVHPSCDCVGVVFLVQMTFRGLQIAKKWGCLTQVSRQLIDCVYQKIEQDHTMPCALYLWLEILLGYQHAADLFEQNVDKLVAVAQLQAQRSQAGATDTSLRQQFVIACAALMHSHRGYEDEVKRLKHALTATLGNDVEVPTAAAIETLLRNSAWVLPTEKLDKYLTSVEGKWVIDEFSADQHASGGSTSQNAGSVLLKKVANVFVHEITTTLENPEKKTKLRLNGYIFKEIPEMQVLLSFPEKSIVAPWKVEGHWSQLYDEQSAQSRPIAPVGPLAPPTWSCRACTMINEGTAKKCATCGTDGPVSVAPQPIQDGGVQGSNPAPFAAVFDTSYSFMRMRWSRGEQQGVWLARKESITKKFDLQAALLAASDVMTDTVGLPVHAFSPSGSPSNVLVLEKPVLPTYSSSEFTLQIWIRPEAASDGIERQVVVANGSDFELCLDSTGVLTWHIVYGRYMVISSAPLPFNTFSHITLLFGKQKFTLLVDERVVGEVNRTPELESGVSWPTSSLLSIGGSLTNWRPEANGGVYGCFYGAIVDLRIWSKLVSGSGNMWSTSVALEGQEEDLIGYYPLVGDSPRLLVDLTKNENHACVYEAYDSSNGRIGTSCSVQSNFAPSASVENIPVKNLFATTLGSQFLGSGRFYLSDTLAANGTKNGLTIDCNEDGAALWYQDPVTVSYGFVTSFSVISTTNTPADNQPSSNTVVFALSDASYWKFVPLLAEAASLSTSTEDLSNSTSNFNGSALLMKISSYLDDSGINLYNIGVYIWSSKRAYALSRVLRIAGNNGNTMNVEIQYKMPPQILGVKIGGHSVFECAVDVELALQLHSSNTARTGLVFPSNSFSGEQERKVCLTSWKFEAFNEPQQCESGEAGDSILAAVYPSLRSGQSAHSNANEPSGAESTATTCTRISTDGSAVTQESYGCQTCNIVHGSSLCRVCAIICHEGHELVGMGVISTACACHVRGNGLCRCCEPIPISEFPLLKHPVKISSWCCSKCTVINSVELQECNVCGNKAPQIDCRVQNDSPSSSTSRALALVKPTKSSPPSVEWSCSACTMLNSSSATKCSICDTARPITVEPEVTQPSQDNNGLITLYYAAEDASKQNSTVNPASASWICSACTMENKGTDDMCYMCSTTRAVPIVDAMDATEVPLALPSSKVESVAVSTPVTLDTNAAIVNSSTPGSREAGGQDHLKVENAKFLHGYKHTVAQAFSQSNEIEAMSNSTWETTVGKMVMSVKESFVGEYIQGTYLENDGRLGGIAKLTNNGAWKMEGRFKKLVQSQENAFAVQWDLSTSRFDGKWFRGDGSGDWKCIASPNTLDFRGLANVDQAKQPHQLQPYYSGLINMKQNLTNVCYQNSFLQTLFMTQDFRQLILSCDVEGYFATPMEDGVASNGDILRCIQDLFARMAACQRPSLDTHSLQRCLPANFQAGRQQDTSDFAHFLIDSLSQQLSQQEETVEGISNIFGGLQATILACKTCGKQSVNREYFWELLLNMIDLRYTPITSIAAVTGSSTGVSTPAGYERLNNDLNKDRNGAPYVFLCVKRCPERDSSMSLADDDVSTMPITDIVVKTAPVGDVKPTMQGYERIELDLNCGGSSAVVGGKKQVYLFYRREPNGSPITDLQVVYGNESIPDGFKQIRVDLNQGEGTKVFLCYRCDMPITDLKIVNCGIPGYRMVDHLLNLHHDDAVKQYLALKVGGNEPCLTDMKLADGDDVAKLEQEGWASLGSPLSSSFTMSESVPSQLMVRWGHGNPIVAIDVFRAPRQVPKYNDYEVIDLYPSDLTTDVPLQLAGDWMASEDTDRARKALRIRSVSEPMSNALFVKGTSDDKGEISGVAIVTSNWSQSLTADAPMSSSSEAKRAYQLTGYWKSSKIKHAQLFDVELRPASSDSDNLSSNFYTISGTIGDGKGRSVTIQGTQSSRKLKLKWPISQIYVLRGDERVPEGVEVVRETCSGRSGNLLAQTQSPYSLYLAVKREEIPTDDGHITDVCVIYGEIDAVPENYTCVQTTPAGHSANLNDGTAGVPIFICYRRSDVTNGEGLSTEKALMDLALMWTSGAQKDTVPSGFTKLQYTPLGMDANLNQGTTGVAIHLCFAKCDPSQIARPIDHPMNGEYEITTSTATSTGVGRFLSLSVMKNIAEARTVEGNFGTVLHGYLPGTLCGTLFDAHNNSRTLLGVWSSDSQGGAPPTTMSDFMPPSFPFELSLNDSCSEFNGWWSGADETSSGNITSTSPSGSSGSSSGGKWHLMRDSYVRIAFKKDYATEWKNGKIISSERVWRHDLASMLSRVVATRTLGGDNMLSCSVCEKKTESRTHTVIVAPPSHLILTLKRMYYDWTQQKTRKCLHDVEFPALLSLPALTEEEEAALYEKGTAKEADLKHKRRSRHYGLYGVLVHSGLTANSGHYYSFCRESDASAKDLHLEDSSVNPWIKFNDMKVERSSWKEINQMVSSSVSDTVYLLLYKRIPYQIPTPQKTATPLDDDMNSPSGDEDEAMLLAKAMALSMSAASQKHGADPGAEEKKEDAEEESVVTSHINKRILKQVEKENTDFFESVLSATSSELHADDLHTLLMLRHSLPLHLRAILEQIQTDEV